MPATPSTTARLLLALTLALGALAAPAAADAPPRVRVDLFAEALCPYCAKFLTEQLGGLMDAGFDEVVAFRYVAWGNARNSSQGVQCQHGPAECRLNRLINCAEHAAEGDLSAWLPFVRCLEGTPGAGMEGAVDGCAKDAGLDAKTLHDCAEGGQGDVLEREAAEATAALCPPHRYVPWVLVNDVPLFDSFDKLQLVVCAAYTGERPDACFKPPPGAAGALTLLSAGVGQASTARSAA